MPKVSYTVGFTLNINPAKNEYMRATVELHDIDTEVDVVEQLRACHTTLHSVMQWADEQLINKIEAETKRKWVEE